MSERFKRLQEDVRREVSDILQRQVKDPRLGFVSITDVEVSRDLSYAKVFVSVFGSEEERQQTMAGLTRAAGFVRSELAKRIRARHIPEIQFHYDPSLEHGARINAILRDLKDEGGEGHE